MAPIDNLKESGKYKVTTASQTSSESSFKDEVIGEIYDKLEPEKIPEYLLGGIGDFLSGKKPDKDIPYSKVYFQDKVAKEFGDVNKFSEWVKALDETLKVQSFFAIKSIKERGQYDWDGIVAAMHNADGLAMVPDSHKKIYDTWAAENTNWFKFDGSADANKVRQIKAWFKKAICDIDPSIYENSVIVKEGVVTRLAKIAAETGASVNSFKNFWANKDSKSEKVLEIGLIRFPDTENPHIKLYRIQIFAWYNSARVLMVQHDQAGFDLEFDVMKFKANDSIVAEITKEQLKNISNKLEKPATFDF